jgi:hypothetical protein
MRPPCLRLALALAATMSPGLACADGGDAPACALRGEVIQWVADYCMAQLQTDDEIVAADCIEREHARRPADPCAAKRHFKRALCGLSLAADGRHASVEQCLQDRSFMGHVVRDGGVGR